MRIAARELTSGNATLMTIADAIGYGSEAAFSRAFKRAYGVSPSVWRRSSGLAQVQRPGAWKSLSAFARRRLPIAGHRS